MRINEEVGPPWLEAGLSDVSHVNDHVELVLRRFVSARSFRRGEARLTSWNFHVCTVSIVVDPQTPLIDPDPSKSIHPQLDTLEPTCAVARSASSSSSIRTSKVLMRPSTDPERRRWDWEGWKERLVRSSE